MFKCVFVSREVRGRVADFLPFLLPIGVLITGASDAVSCKPPEKDGSVREHMPTGTTYQIGVA
jgi:hypothetical protein